MKKIHFENTQDRLDFLRGKHTEIVPIEVEIIDSEKEPEEEKEKEDAIQAD